MRKASGFTLVELLVAISIFLVFVSAVYATLIAGQTSMVRAQDQEDLAQTGRVIMAMMSTELASAYQPAQSETCELLGEDSTGTAESEQEDRLTFLTTAHAAEKTLPAGDLCRVTYSMGGEGTREERGLYLQTSTTPNLEVETDVEPERRLLSPLVIGLNCKYLPADGEWETEWGEGQTTLPVAVRVELTLQAKRPKSKPVVMVMTTNLAMATAPPTTGASNAQP